MISAPRIVVVSVLFFPMGLFYYLSAKGADYTVSARNPTAASAMKGLPLSSTGRACQWLGSWRPHTDDGDQIPQIPNAGSYPLEWTSKSPGSNLEGGLVPGGQVKQAPLLIGGRYDFST